jgi:hypothetical protein
MFIDKPITVSEQDAKDFMAELKENNVPISGGSCVPLEGHVQAMKQAVLNETYGKAENYTGEVVFFVEQVTGHVIPDFRFALRHGIDALIEEANSKTGEFYEAAAVSLSAVKILIDRYIELINKKI